ncbi:LuxR family transcriptional regulator [Bradyrhizobium sp. Arg68]|uniref:HD domain-containing phosphohydrolase n=1 Tax=Bradyrhizobium ivorense TaxID=2511166 RepID=UPI001E41AAC4|nr:HD domain-containing phosphohydrolase [Bradyrhizobium ivorense]MCC8938520.1 LuxR family transcriptional regulator [Bradyrhizobium ivorense]
MSYSTTVQVFDVVRVLAFVGDLSMGQPSDHSIRTAWLADRLAAIEGFGSDERSAIRQAALLRWSGCTANASGFTELIGDDVAGREAMLATRDHWRRRVQTMGSRLDIAIAPLAHIHCDVSGELARQLKLCRRTEETLLHVFETYDGRGVPNHLPGKDVPISVFIVALAGDLEIFSRVYGFEGALSMIGTRADVKYPAALVAHACTQAGQWFEALERENVSQLHTTLLTDQMSAPTSAELIADVIDLKLAWMTGFSRRVAEAAAACSAQLGLDVGTETSIRRAGLIHAIGRASIPNSVWNSPTGLPASAWDRIRLVPYWTSLLGKRIDTFERAAAIASFCYERLDGSGYFRGASDESIPIEGRILAAAVAWVALCSSRPWRPAMPRDKAESCLAQEVRLGRLDPEVVRAMIQPDRGGSTRRTKGDLTVRETEILRLISRGASNKIVAKTLGLRPSTVRTHIESIFRKLNCSTRAAATLKASAKGLL